MPPEDPVCISFDRGREAAQHDIKLLCQRILPGWADVSPEAMQVADIAGGISNLLVKVTPPPPLQPVAVKVFGDKTELLIDREVEKHTLLQLNREGFGAPVLGLFHNGRIEAFLTAKTLTPEEMADPRFVPHIARRLRAFHGLQLDVAASSANAAASAIAAAGAGGEAAAAGAAAAAPAASGGEAGGGPKAAGGEASGGAWASQWDAIFGWLRMARGLSFDHDPVKQAKFKRVDFDAMEAELASLRALCDRVESPLVLCHNDLLSGNILVVYDGQPAEGAAGEGAAAGQGAAEGGGDAGGEGQAHTDPQRQAKRRRSEAAAAAPRAELPPGGGQSAQQEQEQGVGAAGGEVEGQGPVGPHAAAVRELGGPLQFIDFEYSCYGQRGFDLGNHFNEYAGFDCVYDRFPTPEQQHAFLRHYLGPRGLAAMAADRLGQQQRAAGDGGAPSAAAGAAAAGAAAAGAGAGGATAGAEGASGASAGAQEAAEREVLERLAAEACVYALASHAYWGVWSFIQARYSPIDFDYLSYSELRWTEYYRRKEEFVAAVERLFPPR